MKRVLVTLCVLSCTAPALAKDWHRPSNEEWRAMIADMAESSMKQNHGKPQYRRFCELSEKTCSEVLTAKKPDGGNLALIEVEYASGKLKARYVCTINATSDVRNRLSMEDSVATRYMEGHGRRLDPNRRVTISASFP